MIEDIYTDALLSAAAYADWSLLGTINESKIKKELIDNRGFTEEQYKTMFDPDIGLQDQWGQTRLKSRILNLSGR
jgi:hypothetical protein